MSKYKYLQVHTLHYTLVDEEGNDNGKVYEYDGDHSLFCDGIDFNDLKGIKDEQAPRISKTENFSATLALARSQRLQATSGKLQAPSRKLDKTEL